MGRRFSGPALSAGGRTTARAASVPPGAPAAGGTLAVPEPFPFPVPVPPGP